MNQMLALINLFIAPLLSVSIECSRTGVKPEFSARLLLIYAKYAVVNIPAAHVFVVLIKMVSGQYMVIDTARYTVLALAAAVLVPYVLEIGRKCISIRFRIDEK